MCYVNTVNGLEGQGQYWSLSIQNIYIYVPNFYALQYTMSMSHTRYSSHQYLCLVSEPCQYRLTIMIIAMVVLAMSFL